MKNFERAFTIVELLVSVSIVILLLALSLPSLTHAKRKSIENKSLANMRTHSTVLHQYANDYRGDFPFLTNPDAYRTILRGGGQAVETRFFGLTGYWFIGLTDQYYGSSTDFDLFAYPGPGGGVYLYSSTLFTSHQYWNPSTRNTTNRQQWRSTQLHQVRFPSAKAAFTEARQRENATVYPIWSNYGKVIRGEHFGFAFTDGSSRRPPTSEITLPYRTGDGGGSQSQLGTTGVAGVHTLNGILGRDVMN